MLPMKEWLHCYTTGNHFDLVHCPHGKVAFDVLEACVVQRNAGKFVWTPTRVLTWSRPLPGEAACLKWCQTQRHEVCGRNW